MRGTGHVGYSEAYNAWLYRRKRHVLRRAVGDMASGTRALDVGSGVGWVVAELLDLGADVEGLDIAEPAVEGLTARFPGIPFLCVALGSEPIPRDGETYGLVTAMDVLYHVTDDALWRNAIKELGRVLRSAGMLIVSDGLNGRDRDVAEHVRFRSRDRWEEAASSAGLELAQTYPLYRWLSRPPRRISSHLPGQLQGALQYGLEYGLPRRPHMRCAVLRKVGSG